MTDVKEPNYTAEMVEKIRAQAPLNREKAEKLGAELGKSYRSIIAKAKREGIEYIAAEPAPKKGKDAPTKKDIVGAIRAGTGLKLLDLDKAPLATLTELAKYLSKMLGSEAENAEAVEGIED